MCDLSPYTLCKVPFPVNAYIVSDELAREQIGPCPNWNSSKYRKLFLSIFDRFPFWQPTRIVEKALLIELTPPLKILPTGPFLVKRPVVKMISKTSPLRVPAYKNESSLSIQRHVTNYLDRLPS